MVDRKESKEETPSDKRPPAPPIVRLGELLIKEGLLKEKDIEDALSVQRQEAAMSNHPLGEILVAFGMLARSDLEHLLNHPSLRQHIGSLAVERGFLNKHQLEECLKKQAPDQLLGNVLIKEGFLTPEDLQKLLKEQMDTPRFGEIAVKLRLISDKNLQKALRIQKAPRMLGEILCEEGVIHPVDLYYVLNKHKKQSRVGEILVKLGYLENAALNAALKEQKNSSESLGELLIRKKLITPQQLQDALSQQASLPFRSLEGFAYSEEDKKALGALISQRYAEKNLMIPLSLENKDLTIGLVRPEDIHNARELKDLYKNIHISCVLIKQEKFNELFDILYSKKLGVPRSKETVSGDSSGRVVEFMEMELNEDLGMENREVPGTAEQDIEAEELLNFIIKYGISNKASDIHLEQDREGVKLRYRIDGVLQDVKKGWLVNRLQEKAGALISRVKIISSLDIAERRLPQDGVFRITYYDKAQRTKFDLDFRVATCRAISGENVNIRILDPRKANVGLENLNHAPHVLEPFKRLLKSSAGMILVSGPTGSGKTTTLYGALRYIYTPYIKIITAEDPIEYNFPGIMQTQVYPKINLTFERLLRSFLRLDPDVILIGEIRDQETAKISFDATQTGHLLLSTIHTNDSVSSVSRLLDLDVERTNIASSLTCVMAQRLVRKICTFCIKECIPDNDEWSLIFRRYPTHLKFYTGMGCEACGFTGYKGQTLISEIFVVDKEISKALSKGSEEEEIQRLAIEKGMKTMLDDGILKLKETTLSEIIRAVPYDMIQEYRSRKHDDSAEAYAQQDTEGHRIPEPEKPAGDFVFSHPEKQRELVDLMHERYRALASPTNMNAGKIDLPLFREFITHNFFDIKSHHECGAVKFSIQNNGKDVEISATPIG